MNILVINASPRGEAGNTIKLASAFLEGITENSSEHAITILELKSKKFKSCKGCFYCWNNPEHKCALNDDMPEMLRLYIEAELIIWVTPLYHHTMTSIMKKFIERTLPITSPLIVDTGKNGYVHPPIFESTSLQKHILISSCGFPGNHNFELLKQDMNKICNGKISAEICCGMGELLRVKAMKNSISWYLDLVKQAGCEYILNGKISDSITEKLTQPLVDVDQFVSMANLSWDNPELKNTAIDLKPSGKGFRFLSQMKLSFCKTNNLNLDVSIEYDFTDLGESAYFLINKNEIELSLGETEAPTLKIITPFKIWKKIADGEIDGAQALMSGLYKIEGDMALIKSLGHLFGGEKDNKSERSIDDKKHKFYGIKGEDWMGISFIPWILSWILIEFKPLPAAVIPLVISLFILILKKRVHSATYFEKMNGMYFLGLSAFAFLYPAEILKIGSYLNYFAMASIWFFSIFGNISLTADYSKYSEGENMIGNPFFDVTNEMLSVFWALIFIVQGVSKMLLDNVGYGIYSIGLYALIFLAFKFTKFFSSWYPEYLAKGGKICFRTRLVG